jgi:hypothetical protein
MPGDALIRHLNGLRRTSRRSAAWRALAWTLAAGGPLAVALVLHSRITNPSTVAAMERFVAVWTAIVLLAVFGWLALRLRPGASDGALASALDRRHHKAGLFSAAAFALGADPAPGLADVVLERADSAVGGLSLGRRDHVHRVRVKRALLFLVLSFLLALVPGGPRGSVAGVGAGSDGGASPEPGPDSREAVVDARPESRDSQRVPLDEIARLTLKSDHQIYPLNGEIHLTVELQTLRPVASEVPLEVMLALTDGLPSPDVGFGEGWRPVPLRLNWSVPKEEGATIRQRFPLKETLQALKLYKPGLITATAFARPKDDGGDVDDGARSNEITFQIAENKEDLQTKMPQQAPSPQKQPEKPKPGEQKDDKGRQEGRSKPKLGDPDRLAGAQRVASLVQPIVNAGPTVDKEVSVFDQEKGGPAPPMPVPRKPPPDDASRTFLRRNEVPIQAPELSVEERDVLRRYFDSIRAQKKL